MIQFNRLAVGRRLVLGFGIVLALMVVLTAVGVGQVREIDRALTTMDRVNSVKQRYAINFRGSVHDRSIALRDVVLADDPAMVDENNALIDKLAADYEASAAPLDAMVDDPGNPDAEEKRILQTIREIEIHTLALIERTRELRAQGDVAAAQALVLGEAAPAFVTWLGRINELIDLQESKNQELAAAAGAGARGFAWLMLVLCALALVAGGVVAWRISVSVVAPLRKALDVAQRVGAGDLGSRIQPRGSDETARLLAAMARMQQQLIDFCDAQREIAVRHEAGETSHRMREDFPGVYGAMARDINELVASHVDLNMRIAEMVDRYGVGDFTSVLEPLPGEKARLNEVMEAARDNLTAISTEIKELSSAAAAGDFSARGDAHRFQAGFREMVSDLNHLMATAEDNLSAVSVVFGALARGDLTARMAADHPGVFGQIAGDASDTGQRLAEIVRDIKAAVAEIQMASSGIAAGNTDLSRRTEQQAASLEETSALMAELTEKVRRNAEHAQQANRLARDAVGAATDGGAVVQEVVATMDSISGSSHRIADIIGVIDGIAFQTNILALNASVEAARAGEHGRGFAVVASEVRSLAQRSAGAAKDIKLLIEESVRNVDAGAERVSRAGGTMERLVDAVHGVTGIMGEITSASAEQHGDIEQVGERVRRLEEVTQQNASLVEEASAAARALNEQAIGLAGAVEVFRVGGGPESTAQPAPAALPPPWMNRLLEQHR